jgi:hypothetical protein
LGREATLPRPAAVAPAPAARSAEPEEDPPPEAAPPAAAAEEDERRRGRGAVASGYGFLRNAARAWAVTHTGVWAELDEYAMDPLRRWRRLM